MSGQNLVGPGPLTKHRTIVKIVPEKCDHDMFFDNIDLEDDKEIADSECYQFPRTLWIELGCPEEITLTIEPGDKLNV